MAANIRALRGWRGRSVRSLSAALEQHCGRRLLPSAITKIEQGHRAVEAGELADLATVLGVHVGQMFQPDPTGDAVSAIDVETHRELFVDAARALLRVKQLGLPLYGVLGYLEFVWNNTQRVS